MIRCSECGHLAKLTTKDKILYCCNLERVRKELNLWECKIWKWNEIPKCHPRWCPIWKGDKNAEKRNVVTE